MTTEQAASLSAWLPRLRRREEEPLDAHWLLVAEIVRESDAQDVLTSAMEWVADDDPLVQCIGLDLLGELTLDHPDVRPHLVVVAERLLGSPSVDVRWTIAQAMQYVTTSTERSSCVLLALLRDEDDDVRIRTAVTMSCPGEAETRAVSSGLLAALRDPNPEVRDWSAFGLGTQRDIDTPELRDALFALLDDPEADTAGEALVGLARRSDARTFAPLLAWLQRGDAGNLIVAAAREFLDPRLLPALESLKTTDWEQDDLMPEMLDEAISACRAGTFAAANQAR